MKKVFSIGMMLLLCLLSFSSVAFALGVEDIHVTAEISENNDSVEQDLSASEEILEQCTDTITENQIDELASDEMDLAETSEEIGQDGTAYTGTCGLNVKWTYEDGTLTISGSGAMTDFTYNTAVPWADYIHNVTKVVIEEGVTHIGNYAFYSGWYISTVSLPYSLKSIGEKSFMSCFAITRITFPLQLESIGKSAFLGCTSLQGVAYPSSLKSIGDQAFALCSALQYSVLPVSLESLGAQAFYECTSLTFANIPRSVEEVGYRAFYGCTSLEKACILGGVTTINQEAFAGCSNLYSVLLPETLTTMGSGVFADCPLLTSAGPSGGGYSIEYTWFYCIPAYAFNGDNCLTYVAIPAYHTAIGYNAFINCDNITDLYYYGTEEQFNNLAGTDTAGFTNEIWLHLHTLPGDMNWDLEVNALDILQMVRYYLGLEEDCSNIVDVNGDGSFTLADIVHYLRYVSGEEGIYIYL